MGKLASQAALGNQLPASSLPSQREKAGQRPALQSDRSEFKAKPQPRSQGGLSGANHFLFLLFRMKVSTCRQWARSSPQLFTDTALPHPWGSSTPRCPLGTAATC